MKRKTCLSGLPNLLSLMRMGLSLFLLFLPYPGTAFLVVYLICGSTDMADGFLARKFHWESIIGARLDSLADLLMLIICFIKILPAWKLPVYMQIWLACLVAARLAVQVLRHRRGLGFLLPHTAINKCCGLLLFVAPLLALWIAPYGIALGLLIVASGAVLWDARSIAKEV